MSIYDIDFNTQYNNLEVPQRRLSKFKAFFAALFKPLQWLHDLFFTDYVGGVKYSPYNSLTVYTYGDRITHSDRSNYEYINSTPTSGNDPVDTNYWLKIQDVYLGVDERAKYTSMKIILERVLNTYFNTTPTSSPDIYIDNNDVIAPNFVVYPIGSGNTVNVYAGSQYQTNYVFTLSYASTPNCFTVNVPITLSDALTSEPPDSVPSISPTRESIIRALIDKYNTASVGYNIITY